MGAALLDVYANCRMCRTVVTAVHPHGPRSAHLLVSPGFRSLTILGAPQGVWAMCPIDLGAADGVHSDLLTMHDEIRPTCVVLRVTGELDLNTVGLFQAAA